MWEIFGKSHNCSLRMRKRIMVEICDHLNYSEEGKKVLFTTLVSRTYKRKTRVKYDTLAKVEVAYWALSKYLLKTQCFICN